MEAKSRKRYDTDLTDAEWEIIEPLLPAEVKAGAPRTTNFREVVNAVFYTARGHR
ncbi:MAG: transposase, partial [Planctomycetaceae bacterium]